MKTRLQDEGAFQNVILRTYEDDDPYAWSVIAVLDDMGFLAVDKSEAGEYRVKLDTAQYKQTSIGNEDDAEEDVDRYLNRFIKE